MEWQAFEAHALSQVNPNDLDLITLIQIRKILQRNGFIKHGICCWYWCELEDEKHSWPENIQFNEKIVVNVFDIEIFFYRVYDIE